MATELERAVAAMRERLTDILDLCDPMIADKDFSLETEAERFDAIARHANAALSNVSTATGSDAGEEFERRTRAAVLAEREACAGLFESINPASDIEREHGDPGAGAMGAVLAYRNAIRSRK